MSFDHGSVLLGAGKGKTVTVMGDAYTIKAAREETGGAYSLIESTITGGGPPPHIHLTEEEAFYVLEGKLEVRIGDNTVTATPGSFVLVPRGTVHSFTRTGTEPARLLIILSPAGFERFFEEISGIVDPEKIMAVATKYNLEFVGPPPGESKK